MPVVTVVIPAYNARRYLRETIDSVRAQTMDDWALVVVNDGSTDDTAEIASEFACHDGRIRLVQQNNRGLAEAQNCGVRALPSDSEFVMFIGADDVLDRDALQILTTAASADRNAVVAYGLAQFIDQSGCEIRPGASQRWTHARRLVRRGLLMRPLGVNEADTLHTIAACNPIQSPGAAVIRTQALAAAGSFDGELTMCEDWDMWIRLARLGRFRFVDEVVLMYRLHDHNMSGNRELLSAGEREVAAKALNAPWLTEAQHRELRRSHRALQRHLAFSKWPLILMAVKRGKPAEALRQLSYALGHARTSLQSTGRHRVATRAPIELA